MTAPVVRGGDVGGSFRPSRTNRFVVSVNGYMVTSEVAEGGLHDLRRFVEAIGDALLPELAPKKDLMMAQVNGACEALARISGAILRSNRKHAIEEARRNLADLIAEDEAAEALQ